jgi:hypothetical protein
MKLNQLAAGAAIAGALGVAALGAGTGLANAAPLPTAPGPVPTSPVDFHGPRGPGVPIDHGPGGPGGPGPWHGDPQRGYFRGAPWGNGPAPWGYGAPPRPAWGGPLPPPGGRWVGGPVNYWGYQQTPIWNPGFNQWGFWFFGVWVPL